MSSEKLLSENQDFAEPMRVRLDLKMRVWRKLVSDSIGAKRSVPKQIAWIVEQFYREEERTLWTTKTS